MEACMTTDVLNSGLFFIEYRMGAHHKEILMDF